MSSEKDKDDVLFNKKSRKENENLDVNSEDERKHNNQSRRKGRESSGSEREHDRKHKKSDRRKRKSRSRYSSDEYSNSGSDSEDDESDYSGSDSRYSDSESESLGSEESESEEERRRRKRKDRKRRKEREEERERKRRRKEKERMKRKKEKEDKRKKEKKKKKKEKKEKGKKGAVTNSWGKYGVIRETDMWNKRPEFTAWLAEVKQVNLESLSNWEEKQMFKEFMEDHNTATFPSKKYYNLDAYHRRQMEKEMKKGFKKVAATERTVFNDEEQRRLELQQAREKHKEEQVIALKRSMQSGMAQAMREQAQLREEMAYQYKLGNFEAAAAIQRRLDPDAAM